MNSIDLNVQNLVFSYVPSQAANTIEILKNG